ncbi:MAG: hypothetical protein U1B30_10890 [Pseudomonadota bacterium]|nr:hypothetical protein [Pseudomonadota bacterium]
MNKVVSAIKRLPTCAAPMRAVQRGAATILVISMIGIGLVAVSLGTLHTVRGTQERQLAAHAQINAQAAVWATVDVARQYLQSLTPEQLAGLTLNSPWTIGGSDALAQSVSIVGVTPPAGADAAYRITAHVAARAIAAQSSSAVEVVYEVTPAVGGSNVLLNGVLDFYNDLSLSGGIVMKVPGGANINVDGDFDATGSVVGMNGFGLGTIAVTGSVSVASDIAAQELRGKNVSITGGSTAKRIYAFGDPDAADPDDCCGNVTMTGGTGAELIQANGSVTLGGGDVLATVDALRDITVNRGGSKQGTLTAGRDIYVEAGNSIVATRSVGNTSINSNTDIPDILAKGNVTCSPGLSWKVFPSITAGGAINNCKPGATFAANKAPAPVIGLMSKVPKVVMSQPVVDAWAVRATANYIFEYKDGSKKVKVQNVNGIPNGEYYLSTYSGTNDREYLCTAIDAATKKCSNPASASAAKTICNGFSVQNACFGYDTNIRQWTIRGKNLAPGVVWFEGSVDIGSGEYYNTFVASENISSSGSLKVYSLNQAGYAPVCNNQFLTNSTSAFSGLYPSNFCNISAGKMIPNSLGNIALLAGGYDPDDNPGGTKSVYTGGYVTLKAGNYIYGTVLAGNLLGTSGSTYIYGYVSASGLKNLEAEENTLGGSTTIDLTGIPKGADPGEVPDMSGTPAQSSSVVLWSRYL